MIILTALAFIVIFSVLILVHEWGHFTAARKAGIHVEEFGIGLPPKAKKIYKDKKGTIYTLNWIPFGGFVRLYGEDSYDPKILKNPKSFASKSIAKRTAVITAGVVMNFVLAWALITIGFIVGMKPFLVNQSDLDAAKAAGIVETQQVLYVHDVVEGGPLDGSDLQEGDLIVELDGQSGLTAEKFSAEIGPTEPVLLKIVRDGQEGTLVAQANDAGKLGVVISSQDFILNVNKVSYPIYQAPIEAFKESIRLAGLTVVMLGDVVVSIFSKLAVPDGVAGPVGIAQMTHQFAQEGMVALLQFTALLSISLAVINIMPFPALDGGRFLFILIEIITRRKPNAQMEAIAHTIGFALLMLLIVLITWNDIVRLVG